MNGIVVVIMLTLRITAWLVIMTVRLAIWLSRKVFFLFKKLGSLLIGLAGIVKIFFQEFGKWLARKWKQRKKSQK